MGFILFRGARFFLLLYVFGLLSYVSLVLLIFSLVLAVLGFRHMDLTGKTSTAGPAVAGGNGTASWGMGAVDLMQPHAISHAGFAQPREGI